ncbi:MAG TPA: rod-binding protein [Vitreimonas sp.]|uniref:rod-binding protein n=1 Tax=Vitreimonas sp. TaxID=3069702 RepID=UPI002D29021E|nr:rod-binding protein [Vitreimonas sp.]HYD88267.1 rod-binding protein [Vitreimonas sp.]
MPDHANIRQIGLPGAPLPLSTAPRNPPQPTVPDEIRRAAEEFEAVFLSEMLAPMFDGIDADGLGGGGMGEQIFRPMLVERYAEAIARAGGVGIADAVMREMLRMQGEAPALEAADGAGG